MSQIHGKQIKDGSIGLAKWDTTGGQTVILATGSMIGITDGPINDTDLANKRYVDNIASGLDPKESVQVTTIGTLTGYDGSTGTNGGFASIDLTNGSLFDLGGYILKVGDRVLVKDQVYATEPPLENGIYEVITAGMPGTLHRAKDADGTPSHEVSLGNFTFVEKGGTYGGSGWVLSDTDSILDGGVIIPGTNTQFWTQFSGAGSFNGGDGIDISGSWISVDLDTNSGLGFSSNKLRIDSGFAGNGTSITNGVLNIGSGNGITVNTNDVGVKQGTGILVDSNGVHFDGTNVVGTGITWDGTKLNVTATDLSGIGGKGLLWDGAKYDVVEYHGIWVDSNGVSAKQGNGISVDANGINVVGGNGITVTPTDVSVNVGHGIAVGATGVYLNGSIIAGTGISWDGSTLSADLSSIFFGDDFLSLDGDGLSWNSFMGGNTASLGVNTGNGIDIIYDRVVAVAGNGIIVDRDGINIDPSTAGNGITWSGVTNEYSVDIGIGLDFNANKIEFDGADVAGAGLSWIDNKLNYTAVLHSEYANVTTDSSDNFATTYKLGVTPNPWTEVKVYINGQLQRYGTTHDYYFSIDGTLSGAKNFNTVGLSDTFMWNATTAGFPLSTDDLVTITYDTNDYM